MSETTLVARPDVAQLWAWLADVPDPEIPVVSIVDLGIVRDVAWSDENNGLCVVTVTPTYSGCPATEVIGSMIREALLSHSVERVELRVQLSPAWTTDWVSSEAHNKLREFGIAPPMGQASGAASHADFVVLHDRDVSSAVACPNCASIHTERISEFGSTPCKSLHRCMDCLEPFDYFKCH